MTLIVDIGWLRGPATDCARRATQTSSETRLFFAFSYVAASIPHFVSFEVRSSDTLCRFGFLAGLWQGALIAVLRMETVIYVALEVAGAMKPQASADENVPGEPFWTIISGGSTTVRSGVVVTIGTLRRHSDFNADLSLYLGSGSREADSSETN
jgi:hypothetical protein